MSASSITLTCAQRDRVVGVLLGGAAGDALGAGYEFQGPVPVAEQVGMIGGGLGPFAAGEWTDDTAMAIAIAEIAATGSDLLAEPSLDYIVERWNWWARDAKDVGNQTSSVLAAAAREGISAHTARTAAAEHHRQTGRSAGNGSLMRTAPVALAYLHDEAALVRAARTISALTHFDPDAGDACVLWCTAIRHAVLTGEADVRIGLRHLDTEVRTTWAARLDEAERAHPRDFAAHNGWVVAALQGAWSAITTTPVPAENPAAGVFGCDHLRLALEAAVRGGGDTDTVAAIAGGLLGAVHGASAVPWRWRRALKGWPGLDARGLVHLANLIVDRDEPERFDQSYGSWRGYPKPKRHPRDEDVWFGAAPSLHKLPSGVDAVVSLCRVVDAHIPSGVVHLDVRLIDRVGANANLDFVLLDTVRAIEELRAQGRTVFVHGLGAGSRAPAVAALYGSRRRSMDVFEALFEVCEVLPDAGPNRDFRAALRRLRPTTESALSAASTVGPHAPATYRSAAGTYGMWAYWDALFPTPPRSEFIKFKRNSAGVNIARRFWDQREYLRHTYESVFGDDPNGWPSRHPGVALDAVPKGVHAACLGCTWFDPHGRRPLQDARRHETTDGEFTGGSTSNKPRGGEYQWTQSVSPMSSTTTTSRR